MNPLKMWFIEFKKKRDKIVEENNLKTPEEIVEFFTYSHISKKYPDFCPLFKLKQKCHNLNEDELVCYFCACPFYDYDYYNEEKKEYGRCKINSIYGKRNEYGYWDCSGCLLPHRKKFVLNYLKKHKV